MENKKEILVSAYSVNPYWGSEPGMAWNWIKALSKYYFIHLITNTEFKNEIKKGIHEFNLNNIKLYYNDIGERATKMGKDQGDWRFYYYYNKWQKKTLKIAQDICEANNIILVHQLNMHGFREPGYLWKLNLPSVWGPIGGLYVAPTKLDNKSNFKNKLKFKLTRIQLKYFPNILNAFENFNKIIVAVSDYNTVIKNEINKGPFTVELENGTSKIVESKLNLKQNNFFEILWVGKGVYRKRLDIALKAISRLDKSLKIKLSVVGIEKTSKEFKKYYNIAEELGVNNKIVWKGEIPNFEVNKLMYESDLFLFTSINEGSPTVLMEAIQCQLPVVCFDLCGMKDIISSKVGIKINANESEEAINDFSNSILKLYNNRRLLNKLSKNCINYAKELAYTKKATRMLEYYNEAINNFEEK